MQQRVGLLRLFLDHLAPVSKTVLAEVFDFLPLGLFVISFVSLPLMGRALGGSLCFLFAASLAIAAGMICEEYRSKLRLLAFNGVLFSFLNYLHYWIDSPPEGIPSIQKILRPLLLPRFILSADSATLSLYFLAALLFIFFIHWEVSKPRIDVANHPRFSKKPPRNVLIARGIQYAVLVGIAPMLSMWIVFFARVISRHHKTAEVFSFTNNLLLLAVLCLPFYLRHMSLIRKEFCIKKKRRDVDHNLKRFVLGASIFAILLLGFGFELMRKSYFFWTLNFMLFLGLHFQTLQAFIAGTLEEPDPSSKTPFKEEAYTSLPGFALLLGFLYFFSLMGIAALW